MGNATNNVFAAEQPLIARLAELRNEEPRLRCGSAITLLGATDISRYLPGVFVRPTGVSATELVGQLIEETQQWDVVMTVKTIADKRGLAATYTALGKLLHRVITHLNAWNIPDVGMLEYVGRSDLAEIPGRVEMTATFNLRTVIDLSDMSGLADFLRFYPVYDTEDTPQPEDHINLPGPQHGNQP